MLESLNNNKKLLPRQAAEQIIKLIRENQLQAGEKLPNEFDMAQQLSVGRGTIREAVKILESRNIVEIRRGRGTFVCEHPGLMEDPLGLALVEDKERLALDLETGGDPGTDRKTLQAGRILSEKRYGVS